MITNYKINQPFTSNFSVEEGEKNSSHTWNHGAGRDCQPCWNLFHAEARKVSGRKTIQPATLWKPIRSGLDRFFSDSLQRKPFSIIRDYKVHKPANVALNPSLNWRSCATGIDFFHKARASYFQWRPWSPLCSKSAWSECCRKFCKSGIV